MSINKDQIEGRVNAAKGKVKEVSGALVGNETLEAKGTLQKTLGKAQAKYGDVKHVVSERHRKACVIPAPPGGDIR